MVVGNPPWLSYRYVEKGAYQEFLKKEITETYKLLTRRPELLTHMELGALFFVRSAALFLKDGGRIGFVLPKSVLVADQHHALREGSHAARLRLTQVWDSEGMRPLFNVPASVAFGEKPPKKTDWPLAGRIITGELDVRNAWPAEAEKHLSATTTEYWLSLKGTRSYFSETKEKPIMGEALTESSLRKARRLSRAASGLSRSSRPPGWGWMLPDRTSKPTPARSKRPKRSIRT